ncbi:oligosaccharyl transferase subunit ost3/OST6 [Mucor velutinosus]|uniref:Sulfhydryl oxidase n=1 Tax=Mucor velutinosus TaxID=708070 RepID=A0AAN7DJM5_9FUNG|nr:oligosaccharyl transferase subunit ost3/OST6 [Mucor velutinosus]
MRRVYLISLIALLYLILTSLYFVFKPTRSSEFSSLFSNSKLSEITTNGSEQYDKEVIMGFLGNKTEKAELGRATWRFLHTMMGRFPESPSPQERQSLHDFMMLFSRLYPCGECAVHFNKLLKTYPPQTSSRLAASQWLCAMHNKVNERVHKPIYDCSDILSKYPCGCDDRLEDTSSSTTVNK